MRLLTQLVTVSAMAFTANAVYAACLQSTIFACTTTNNKVVEVCDSGKTIDYSFGKKGKKPEMALSVPRADASTYQWDGSVTGMVFKVRIPNGNTIYEVYSNFDRMRHEKSGGIEVYVNKKNVASISCKPETLVDYLDGIELPRGPLFIEDM